MKFKAPIVTGVQTTQDILNINVEGGLFCLGYALEFNLLIVFDHYL